MEYLALKTDPATADLINSDINELKVAAKRLIIHASKIGGLGFGTSFLKWIACFAAMSVPSLNSLLLTHLYINIPYIYIYVLHNIIG